MIGQQLGGYRIESVIGRGGMGIVYLADQIRLERKVALKVITPELAHDVGFRTRFERESRLAASIDHPNVVPVYEAGEENGLLYIAMRNVPGTDLKSVLAREGALEPRRAAAIVGGVAGALDAAHASGLVHRDVKPGNILLEPAQGGERVYLTDFGLTKRLSSASGITETGFVVGTLDYIAPEQVSGAPVDARTDVYALGCVLFHALSGHVPYERNDDMAKMYAHANLPVPSLLETAPNVPPALQDVIERGMAKDPDARYASAGDLGRAAQAALEGHAPTLAERSVAIGAAAPGHATVADTPPPAAPPTTAAPPPGPPTAPTQPLPPEPAAYPPHRPPPQMPMGSPPPPPQRSSAPIVAAVLVLALLIGGAVALLATGTLGGGDDDEPATTTEIRTTPRTDRGDDTTTDGTQPRPRPATTSFEPYSSDLGSFTTVLPTGDGWSEPSESQVSDGLFRVRQTGPDGLEVIIDHTPGEAATFKPADRCVETSVPNFPYASRCQFQGGTLAPCRRATCVDYLLNAGVDGPGWGVLVGGGGALTETQEIARKIAFEMEPTN